MSAHVLVKLLNEFRKRDKMRGLPSILSHLSNEFNQFGLFLTSNKENKHSLHVGALECEQMSSVTWKDVVDLDEIYLRKEEAIYS